MAAAMLLSDEIGIAKRFDAIVAKELGWTAKNIQLRRSDAGTVKTGAA